MGNVRNCCGMSMRNLVCSLHVGAKGAKQKMPSDLAQLPARQEENQNCRSDIDQHIGIPPRVHGHKDFQSLQDTQWLVAGRSYKLLPKLLVSPLISPIIVPLLIPTQSLDYGSYCEQGLHGGLLKMGDPGDPKDVFRGS